MAFPSAARLPGGRVSLVLFTERLFVGKGDVNVWITKVTTQFHAAMVEAAPKRTGELALSIDQEMRHIGVKRIEGAVGPTAPHAWFVLRGTGFPGKGRGGEIWTTRGFVTRNSGDAWVDLIGVINNKGTFTRKGGKRSERELFSVRRKGYWMHLKPDGPFAYTVHGQSPNNFILTAYRRTRRRHRSLPLPPPGVLNP